MVYIFFYTFFLLRHQDFESSHHQKLFWQCLLKHMNYKLKHAWLNLFKHLSITSWDCSSTYLVICKIGLSHKFMKISGKSKWNGNCKSVCMSCRNFLTYQLQATKVHKFHQSICRWSSTSFLLNSENWFLMTFFTITLL